MAKYALGSSGLLVQETGARAAQRSICAERPGIRFSLRNALPGCKWESDEMGASKLNPLSRGDSSLMLTQLSTAKATSRDNKVAHPLRLTQPANRERMNLTSAQQEAIGARGNVLVIAGAGTG